MGEHGLEGLLARIAGRRLAVCGDLCLDASWYLDPVGSELSAETGRPGQAVARQSWTPGGAANIAANAAALGAEVRVLGLVGDDPFGRELDRLLRGAGIGTGWVRVAPGPFATITFAKRRLLGRELERVDFGFANRPGPAEREALLERVDRALAWADAFILNQQVPGTLEDRPFREALVHLLEGRRDRVVLLDSRHATDRLGRLPCKVNEREARLLLPRELPLAAGARRLQARRGHPLFITRGRRGILVAAEDTCRPVAAPAIPGPVDPVGAGDTVTSALAAALAAGATPWEAARLAVLAAGVTVSCLHTTGTAAPAEILALAAGGGRPH